MIKDYLDFFNQDGKEFKVFLYDKDRVEEPTVRNINDLNQGAIHNGVEYTHRFGKRAIYEMDLNEAGNIFLDNWGDFLGIPREENELDTKYRQRIINIISPSATSTMTLFQFLLDKNCKVYEAQNLGGALDCSYLDIGYAYINDGYSGFVLRSQYQLTLYLVFDSIDDITPEIISYLNSIRAAGTMIYIGFLDYAKVRTTRYPGSYLDSSFLDIYPSQGAYSFILKSVYNDLIILK